MQPTSNTHLPREETSVDVKEKIYRETKVTEQKDILELYAKSLETNEQHRFPLTISTGVTVQLRPFEFARVDVSLQIPVHPKTIDQSIQTISDYLQSKVVNIATQIRKKNP